jgi:cytochrome d ubiquinol oxidase subunit I
MELDPVLLSRVQFAFVVSFHIIFPAFTIGLAAWLATIEGMRLATGNPIYRRVFDFWLKIFPISFGMGVVSGIVMAFQFGTNWSVLSERTGSIQGPLLGYEAFTAFMLEATFFGVVMLARERVPPCFYFLSCCMVSVGTMLSSFWIMCNNTWMQVPLGHAVVDGRLVPDDWWAITTGPVVRVRWPHMLLAAFLTTGMSVIATGAWYLLRGAASDEGRVMLRWGLWLVALIIPVQMVFGHLTGDYVHHAVVYVGGVPVLSGRFRRRDRRLVHRRNRPSALGGLPAYAHQGRGDAIADGRRCAVLAAGLHRGLRRHLFIRLLLRLSAVARRADG